MPGMNSRQRGQRWEMLWERDPHVCYLCGLPWYGTWTLEEIREIAKKHNQEIPTGLSQTQELAFWSESKPLAKRKLILEHKDGNNRNNAPENWGFAHQSCNVQKRLAAGPRNGRRSDRFFRHNHLKNTPKSMYERISEDERPNVPTLIRNLEQEPIYREAALRLIRKHGEMFWKELNLAASEKAHCSPITGDRHLGKLTSVHGQLEWHYDKDGRKLVKKRINTRKKNDQRDDQAV